MHLNSVVIKVGFNVVAAVYVTEVNTLYSVLLQQLHKTVGRLSVPEGRKVHKYYDFLFGRLFLQLFSLC